MDLTSLTAILSWIAIVISGVSILLSAQTFAALRREHRELDAVEERERQLADKALKDWGEERQGWLELLAQERGVPVSELRITRDGDEPVKVRTRSEMAAWRRSWTEPSDEAAPS